MLQPPGKGQGGLDFDPEYHGPEGFKRFVTQWKSGFDYFRYEPREIADAGGAHFAFKVGVFGRFAGSGTELEDEWATVYTMKDGLTYRMVNEYEWETAASDPRRSPCRDPRLGTSSRRSAGPRCGTASPSMSGVSSVRLLHARPSCSARMIRLVDGVGLRRA